MDVASMLYQEMLMDDIMELRFEEGMEVGRVIGTMEANKEPPLNIARKLLEMDYSVGTVHKCTGIDIEAILGLTGGKWHYDRHGYVQAQ